MDCIIVSQLKMFNASDPRNYEKFVRPWIFGWRGNPDFESGTSFVPARVLNLEAARHHSTCTHTFVCFRCRTPSCFTALQA